MRRSRLLWKKGMCAKFARRPVNRNLIKKELIMPAIVQRMIRNLQYLIFPQPSNEIKEVMEKEVENLSPEEASRKDFAQVGEDLRLAIKSAKRRVQFLP